MTKEEIIRSKVQYIKEFGVPDYLADIVIKRDALLAMEEYAKQQALEFTDWIFLSDILQSNHPIDAGKYFYNKSGELAANNTEELYYLFLKDTGK